MTVYPYRAAVHLQRQTKTTHYMDIQNEQALVTAKEQWTARMQEKHPGIDINDEEALYGMLLHDEEELSILQQWYDEFNDRHLTPEQREEQLRQASSSIAGECTEDALSSAVSWISAMWEKLSAGELPVEVLQRCYAVSHTTEQWQRHVTLAKWQAGTAR